MHSSEGGHEESAWFTCRSRCLGRFEVSRDGQAAGGFRADKVRVLLAYLATEADRAHRRDALAGLLWPGYAQASALVSLRTALANLRQAIGDAEAEPPFLLITPDAVQFNRASDHSAGCGPLPEPAPDRLDQVPSDQLRQAVEAYGGEFLEGYALSDCPALEEWLTLQREHYRQCAREVLEQLCERALKDGDYRQAERDARRSLELEAWDERAHRQLMSALALGGQRSVGVGAIRGLPAGVGGWAGRGAGGADHRALHSIREGSLKDARGELWSRPARGAGYGRERARDGRTWGGRHRPNGPISPRGGGRVALVAPASPGAGRFCGARKRAASCWRQCNSRGRAPSRCAGWAAWARRHSRCVWPNA